MDFDFGIQAGQTEDYMQFFGFGIKGPRRGLMDVYDSLDLMIRKAESLVPTIRLHSHDKNFAPSF